MTMQTTTNIVAADGTNLIVTTEMVPVGHKGDKEQVIKVFRRNGTDPLMTRVDRVVTCAEFSAHSRRPWECRLCGKSQAAHPSNVASR